MSIVLVNLIFYFFIIKDVLKFLEEFHFFASKTLMALLDRLFGLVKVDIRMDLGYTPG